MLVLARKAGQFIKAGNVMIHILSIEGSKVRVGIKAPPDVLILRGPELVDEQGNVREPRPAPMPPPDRPAG